MNPIKTQEELEKEFKEKFVTQDSTGTPEEGSYDVINNVNPEDIKQFINDNYVGKTAVRDALAEVYLTGREKGELGTYMSNKQIDDLLSKHNIN